MNILSVLRSKYENYKVSSVWNPHVSLLDYSSKSMISAFISLLRTPTSCISTYCSPVAIICEKAVSLLFRRKSASLKPVVSPSLSSVSSIGRLLACGFSIFLVLPSKVERLYFLLKRELSLG
jgi:hypothetical protein